jgi:23S rRNA pseudouridine2605 synthase
MRLNKILANAGVASRRGAEELLAAGRVAVNGRIVTAPGAAADPACDTISVDGRPLPRPARHVYIMLNKPAGVVTTARDPQGRPTVLELVDRPERLFSVGRLDRDTEGLLLLTNDGAWANRVAHPSGGVEKEYEAIVDGVPDAEALRRLAEGVALPDGHLARGTARVLHTLDGGACVSITLHEGHKRQARLMLGAVGHPVRQLRRVRVGRLHLGQLEPGAWRELAPAEIAAVTAASEHKGERERGSGRPGTREAARGGNARERVDARGERGRGGPSERRDRPAGHRHRRSGGVG